MKKFIDKIRAKQDLSFAESKEAFKILMEGKANDQEIFKVFIPSPPVPHVSIQLFTLTIFDFSLKT